MTAFEQGLLAMVGTILTVMGGILTTFTNGLRNDIKALTTAMQQDRKEFLAEMRESREKQMEEAAKDRAQFIKMWEGQKYTRQLLRRMAHKFSDVLLVLKMSPISTEFEDEEPSVPTG